MHRRQSVLIGGIRRDSVLQEGRHLGHIVARGGLKEHHAVLEGYVPPAAQGAGSVGVPEVVRGISIAVHQCAAQGSASGSAAPAPRVPLRPLQLGPLLVLLPGELQLLGTTSN